RGPRPGGRAPAGAGRGDHPFDDGARAGASARDRRLAPAADRGGLGHDGAAGQPAARGSQADGEDDEADGEGRDARTSERRCAYDGTAQEQGQAEEGGEEVDGSENETDAGRLEEEPDLPRRGGRFALAA